MNQEMSQWEANITGWRNSGAVGGKLKEAGISHWKRPNNGATNTSGFTALPCGHRKHTGGFYLLGSNAYFWTASESVPSVAYYRNLYFGFVEVDRYLTDNATGFSVRCLKGAVPTVSTAAVTNITQIDATSGGNVISDGGAQVSARGVCWSTSQNPTTSNSKTTDGTGIGSYISNLVGLTS